MSLSKLFIIFSLLAGTVYAQEIKPLFRLKTSGIVADFVIDGLRLYAANDQGIIDVFDLTTRKITGQILLPPVKDFQDKPLAAKILSVDRFEGKTLFVATGEHGYRNVWMHDGYC